MTIIIKNKYSAPVLTIKEKGKVLMGFQFFGEYGEGTVWEFWGVRKPNSYPVFLCSGNTELENKNGEIVIYSDEENNKEGVKGNTEVER